MVTPESKDLITLSRFWLKRKLSIERIINIQHWPIFVKPLEHKLFPGTVYAKAQQITESYSLSPTNEVICSEIVTFICECRAFCFNGEVLDVSLYKGSGCLTGARDFILDFLSHEKIKNPCVVDVGLIRGRGWALVEINPCWGAHFFNCSPRKILPAIIESTKRKKNDRL